MFAKVYVNGKHSDPIFNFLRKRLPGTLGASIKWNFTKFICNRDGVPVKRYGPPTKPYSFEDSLVTLLSSKASVATEDEDKVCVVTLEDTPNTNAQPLPPKEEDSDDGPAKEE